MVTFETENCKTNSKEDIGGVVYTESNPITQQQQMGKIKIQNLDSKKDYIADNLSDMSTKNLPQTQSVQLTPAPKEEEILIYQIFPSANKFFCGGRLLQSQFPRPFIFAISLIVIPVTLHIVFKLTYGYYQSIFTALTFTFMFITAFSDPGIIPRVDNLANDRDLEMIPIDRSKEKKDGFTLADSSGLTMNYKVCDTCGIYKDKDRKHCRVCDNCVSGFDHHCVWVNNCIGKNNYKAFILFLFFLTAQLIYTIISSACHINLKVDEKMSESDISRTEAIQSVLKKQPLPIFLILYSFAFVMLVGTLFLYHIYLIFNDTTTVEQRKILSFRKEEWKKHFQNKFWYSFKKKFLCLSSKSMMSFRQPVYFKETKKCIFIKENGNKDSESATQVAIAKDNATNKNVDNVIMDFQSFNQPQLQQQCILSQVAKVKDLQQDGYPPIDQQFCSKTLCVEDVKEEICNNIQPTHILSKNRSLQIIELGNMFDTEHNKNL